MSGKANYIANRCATSEHCHSDLNLIGAIPQVHEEFGELFAMKVLIFAQELLSVVLTPFVLWLSLPDCAPAIIDFFREFSVHVDGRGYVCSFAEFNFERHGNVKVCSSLQPRNA
jgi:autophagy-related protein 9